MIGNEKSEPSSINISETLSVPSDTIVDDSHKNLDGITTLLETQMRTRRLFFAGAAICVLIGIPWDLVQHSHVSPSYTSTLFTWLRLLPVVDDDYSTYKAMYIGTCISPWSMAAPRRGFGATSSSASAPFAKQQRSPRWPPSNRSQGPNTIGPSTTRLDQ